MALDKKQLKQHASEAMAEVWPGCAEYLAKSPWRSSSVIYYCRASEALGLEFVMWYLWPKSGRSAFTIEFGWSRLLRIPEVSTGNFALDDEAAMRGRFDELEYIRRIGVFFGHDLWWSVGGKESLTGRVREAKSALAQNVVPFFQLANRSEHKRRPRLDL